jgi:toxin YoeB
MSRSKKKSPAAPAAVVGKPFFTDQAKEDIAWWRQHQPKVAVRVEALIADIRRSPFSGVGKPEPLKYRGAGYWSRRITGEHRLVYRLEDGQLYIAQARFHYEK